MIAKGVICMPARRANFNAGEFGRLSAITGNAGKLAMPLVPTRESIRSSAIMPALLSLSEDHHNNAGDYEAAFKADIRPEQ